MPLWTGIVIALIYGTVIGSFLNVCIWRLPRDESIISPGSHCPKCNTLLKGRDLVPLFSFLIQRRKCRYCGEPITWRYFGIELLTGVCFVLTFLCFHWSVETIVYSLFGAMLIAIFFIDLEHYIIPDQLNLFGIVLGVAYNAWRIIKMGESWRTEMFGLRIPLPPSIVGIVLCGGGFLTVALISYYIFKKEGLGGGDVKLAAAVGAILGSQRALWSFMLAVFLGTAVGLALLASKKKGRKDYLPFGPFMVSGAFIMIFFGDGVVRLWSLYLQWAAGVGR
jgi:leader peptidase (prepilin peptidase)/N-methyltransferase